MQENNEEFFSINKRIIEILDYYGVTRYKFSKNTGISEAVLLNIYKGKNKPSIDFLDKLLTTYTSIDANWLITGNGTMLSSNKIDDSPIGYKINKSKETNLVCSICEEKERTIKTLTETIEGQKEHLRDLKKLVAVYEKSVD